MTLVFNVCALALTLTALFQLAESHGAPDGQEHARLPARHQGQDLLALLFT